MTYPQPSVQANTNKQAVCLMWYQGLDQRWHNLNCSCSTQPAAVMSSAHWGGVASFSKDVGKSRNVRRLNNLWFWAVNKVIGSGIQSLSMLVVSTVVLCCSPILVSSCCRKAPRVVIGLNIHLKLRLIRILWKMKQWIQSHYWELSLRV